MKALRIVFGSFLSAAAYAAYLIAARPIFSAGLATLELSAVVGDLPRVYLWILDHQDAALIALELLPLVCFAAAFLLFFPRRVKPAPVYPSAHTADELRRVIHDGAPNPVHLETLARIIPAAERPVFGFVGTVTGLYSSGLFCVTDRALYYGGTSSARAWPLDQIRAVDASGPDAVIITGPESLQIRVSGGAAYIADRLREMCEKCAS